MRIYELANELNVSSKDVIDYINKKFDRDISNHMSAIPEDHLSDIKNHFQESGNTTAPLDKVQIQKQFKNSLGRLIDSTAFGVGLITLLFPGDKTGKKQEIREKIAQIGQKFTDPLREGTQSMIDEIINLSDQLNKINNTTFLVDREYVQQIIQETTETMATSVVEKAREGVDQTEKLFKTNGTPKKN